MAARATNIPVIMADAGNPGALADPNSPASIMKKAKESEVQTGVDTKFDAIVPPRVKEGFRTLKEQNRTESILSSLFLAAAALLLLYKAAQD